MHVKKIDFSRFIRLLRGQSITIAKSNMNALSNHLVSFVDGSSAECDSMTGMTLRINLKVGHLIVR